ncbi:MAG: hypothetical protein GY696_07235 [Gammaproteobacteria bacterium]|nr:hypothetical protein [Gammaproteobacteria bacterium]
MHECTVPDNKAEAVRQKNLENILTARGMPGPAVNSAQEEYLGPATVYMARMSDMQTACELGFTEGSVFCAGHVTATVQAHKLLKCYFHTRG